MHVMFAIWGIIGLVLNLINSLTLFAPSVGVGQSAYVSAWILLWIGGLLFFGIATLVARLPAAPSQGPSTVTKLLVVLGAIICLFVLSISSKKADAAGLSPDGVTAYATYEFYHDKCEKLPSDVLAYMIVINLDRVTDAQLKPLRKKMKQYFEVLGKQEFCSTLKPTVDAKLPEMRAAMTKAMRK